MLVKHMPRDSAVAQELHGEASEWTVSDYLLAAAVDHLAAANWMFASVNTDEDAEPPEAPVPVPRPGGRGRGVVSSGGRGGAEPRRPPALLHLIPPNPVERPASGHETDEEDGGGQPTGQRHQGFHREQGPVHFLLTRFGNQQAVARAAALRSPGSQQLPTFPLRLRQALQNLEMTLDPFLRAVIQESGEESLDQYHENPQGKNRDQTGESCPDDTVRIKDIPHEGDTDASARVDVGKETENPDRPRPAIPLIQVAKHENAGQEGRSAEPKQRGTFRAGNARPGSANPQVAHPAE
ncbi:hypothetical protein ACK8N7_14075 [Streptomyces griseobrunneus]